MTHGLASERCTTVLGGVTAAGWCLCGQMFTGRALTREGAMRIIWQRSRDHRGTAAAAGPGGEVTG